MFNEILKVDDQFNERCANAMGQVFFWLLGKAIEDVDIDDMTNIWIKGITYVICIINAYFREKE